MSCVAIFRMSCCGKEVVHGRHEGSDMYPPHQECLFGCAKPRDPRGREYMPTINFSRYVEANLLTPELRATAGKWLKWPEVA
jgi:hypothetical protein